MAIAACRRARQRIVELEGQNHPAFCHDQYPSVDQVAGAFLGGSSKYTEFRYDPLPECRTPMTPSKAAAQADTLQVGPLDLARGWPGGAEGGGVRLTKQGDWIVTVLTMNRRKRLPQGEGYFAEKNQGKYLWRSYRLEGIKLSTVLINMGRRLGKVRMFPNCPDGYKAQP